MNKSAVGEWWITEDNELIFADGDVGDVNHEMVVWHRVFSEFTDRLGEAVNKGETKWRSIAAQCEAWRADTFADVVMFRTTLYDLADGLRRDGEISDEDVDDIFASLQRATDFPEDRMAILLADNADNNDYRRWAIEQLGWIRLAGNNVETWQLSHKELARISDALAEIITDSFDRDASVFTVEVVSSRKMFWDVPYLVLAACRMGALRHFR